MGTATATQACSCLRCRVHRGEAQAGPYTPAELQRLVGPDGGPTPGDLDVTRDPEVVRAQEAADQARGRWDELDQEWRRASAAAATAESAGIRRSDAAGLFVVSLATGRPIPADPATHRAARRLEALAEAAKVARDRGWSKVIESNDMVIEAQRQARQRLATTVPQVETAVAAPVGARQAW